MGISYGALKFLMEEGVKERWHGSVLTLGKQDTSFTSVQLREAAARYGYRLVMHPRADHYREHSNMTYQEFFHALGFQSVLVLDASDYEGADIVHDLNTDYIPRNCDYRFNLILDGGTLEHVFNIPAALKTISRMTAIDGRIVHISPMSNCADHGFYSFSPTLFADYYTANLFDISRISLVRFARDPVLDEWEYTEYERGTLGTIGELRPGVHFVMSCVRKGKQSLGGQVPQQHYYENNAWMNKGGLP
jgi:hypothetical protein